MSKFLCFRVLKKGTFPLHLPASIPPSVRITSDPNDALLWQLSSWKDSWHMFAVLPLIIVVIPLIHGQVWLGMVTHHCVHVHISHVSCQVFVLAALQAQAVALTVAQAFTVAFELWQVAKEGKHHTHHPHCSGNNTKTKNNCSLWRSCFITAWDCIFTK